MLYFDKKSCQKVSKIILVYIYVVFKAVFCLLLINYGFIFVCVFQKVERVANLMIFTIYVILLPEQSSRTFVMGNSSYRKACWGLWCKFHFRIKWPPLRVVSCCASFLLFTVLIFCDQSIFSPVLNEYVSVTM